MRLTILAALALTGFSFCQPCLAAADPACKAEIKALMLASFQSGPFQTVSKMSSAATTATATILEVTPPSALHSISTINGAPSSEMTFVDGRGFMKMNGAWTELPPEMAGNMTDLYSPASIEKSVDMLVKAECAVPTNWEGKAALRYVFTTRTGDTAMDITMWIDAASRLPLHSETAYTVAGEAITSITDYTYDPTITIKAPM